MKKNLALALLLLAALLAAEVAAQPRQVRVAYVWLFDAGPSAPYSQPFKARLGELGWKEGRNLRFEEYDAKGDPKRLASIMEDLARTKVDVIVAMCTPEAVAARKATTTIPIVVTAAGDLRAAGLVTNFARPGGNITGMSFLLDQASAKRVELLKTAFPGMKVATVLWNPVRPDNASEVAAMQAAAQRVGMELRSVQVRTRDELSTALEMLAVDGTQGLLNAGDPLLSSEVAAVVKRAAELRIPALYTERVFPVGGGLMSWGPDMMEEARRAAEYVDRILRGEKAGDLPIQQPKRFEFVVNKTAARVRGWELPPSIMVLADELIDK
ncbi:MAG TPA: ABC transporter substrate-binding protein [Usitatibacter sp.]|nr:ABC transporter substrate-binding protein [Usitatibacter sp.]